MVFDIFVDDRVTGKTQRVSVSSTGGQSNAESLGDASFSSDGRSVAFSSLATNLVASDRNEITDVFIRDLRTNRTRLVSLGMHGQGNDASWIGLGPRSRATAATCCSRRGRRTSSRATRTMSPTSFSATFARSLGYPAGSEAGASSSWAELVMRSASTAPTA